MNYKDPSGNSAIVGAVIIGASIGGANSFMFTWVSQKIEKNWGKLDTKDWWKIGVSTVIGAAEGALLVIASSHSMLICTSTNALDALANGIIDGSSIGTIIINTAFSAFLGAAIGADSSDFVKTGKSFEELCNAGEVLKSSARPLTKKLAKKIIIKTVKYTAKSTFSSTIDDIIYGFLEYLWHEHTKMHLE